MSWISPKLANRIRPITKLQRRGTWRKPRPVWFMRHRDCEKRMNITASPCWWHIGKNLTKDIVIRSHHAWLPCLWKPIEIDSVARENLVDRVSTASFAEIPSPFFCVLSMIDATINVKQPFQFFPPPTNWNRSSFLYFSSWWIFLILLINQIFCYIRCWIIYQVQSVSHSNEHEWVFSLNATLFSIS